MCRSETGILPYPAKGGGNPAREALKDHVFMDVAESIASLGTCDRKRVGAVLVRDGRCISWGFNGAPPGAPHCDENDHGWHGEMISLPPRHFGDDPRQESASRIRGCRNATHAEANALAFAARQGISTDGCELFVTVSPCEVCARLLIASGVRRVYYLEQYRDHSGEEILRKAGIECLRI